MELNVERATNCLHPFVEYIGFPHFIGMTLFVKQDIALNPGNISILCPYRIMSYPDFLSNLVQKLLRSISHDQF